MGNPIVADNKPVKVTLSKGQEYHFCTCGRSKSQPFCDGSHVGTSFNPKVIVSKEDGDAYLCASGLPVSNYTHAADMISAAVEIRDFMQKRKKEKEAQGELPFDIRIGLHTGPVVAGIVGVRKFQYDIWGDTVNTAARMETNSEIGKINISQSTYELLKDKSGYEYEHRGKIEAKGKGELDMYFVEPLKKKKSILKTS